MTKEELKEMIDATINENGTRNITGKTLNLALNAIVDALGSGSGEMVYFLHENINIGRILDMEGCPYSVEDLMYMQEHNKQVYAKLADSFRNNKEIFTITLDTSFRSIDHREVLAIKSLVKVNKLECFIANSSPSNYDTNPLDFYNSDDVAVFVQLDGYDNYQWFLPEGLFVDATPGEA